MRQGSVYADMIISHNVTVSDNNDTHQNMPDFTQSFGKRTIQMFDK